ncbi:cytoplasmic protein [Thalassospira alkalitolerans]|uniref:cytoplasmic protein n=1 Tax=Thalassospira alkalitolerans TaxID=1293890 RepID=UPI0030ED279C|tara:strand:+ start:3578 stop:3889 length:312 start_codon:yes stop_codon:yes gene_type:complete
MHEVDLEKAQREETRWRILRVLDAGRPMAVSETVVFRALGDASLPISPNVLRRELDYLRDKKLINIAGEDGPVWSAELTGNGVDVVEYTVASPPGIARPQKWW